MKQRLKRLRPLKGLVGIIFLLIVAFFYAMFQGGFVSWFLFYLLVPLSIYSLFLFFYPLSKLDVNRTIDTRNVYSGGKFAATVHIRRNNHFPLMYVKFEEKVSPTLANITSWKRMIFWGMKKEFTWTYEMDHIPRGEHVLEGLTIQVSDLFGWVKKDAFIPNPKTILVFPNVTEMVYVPIETRYDQGAAVSRIQTMKDTSMATGLRSYQPGDRVSWIHWKSFARTQTLKTKEFEDRQSQDLFVLMDRTPADSFEEIVDLTASILQAIVRHQASSAFLSLGEHRFFIPSVQSESQLQQALYHLTKVQPDLTKSIEQVILHDGALAQATSLLYVTSNLTYEWIDSVQKTASNLRVCTCFVVKQKDEKLLKEEQVMHQFAASRGVRVHTITKDRFAQAFMEVTRS
ncbi:DUF58 domain-containing protein [Psychrobacillus lasiicapitis]|uniref:DUF58 domain-containing protein n=1 Tax=Psychrobacillus lasiicapitis TaxID=1636719 RepID=A0A544T211_9BACI|nr:DUF58 domain-containing protein [Psychrobacillus lasiicapitis]TQR11477.1 DUF58 domain-containing protein [Psychrobacillus lasiicapitis]GGA40218.1 hypothetical protein GCM10011384_32240 [Psychrobacillus lasiicapitis]